jgi:protein-S-isoprenylcysteine O-methyltransferase Ste14
MSGKEDIKEANPKQKHGVSGAAPDRPGVIVFPPLLFLGAIFLGITLQVLWPIHLFSAGLARPLGILFLLAGAALVLSAFKSFKKAGTDVRPDRPTTAIASDGPYRLTRNPIYLGNSMCYLGLAFLFNAFWPLPALVPFFLLLHWGIVLPEEHYLERKFGEAYLEYKTRVRRWL